MSNGLRFISLLTVAAIVSACTSTGSMSIAGGVTMPATELAQPGVQMETLGPAHGKACRGFVLGIIPFGNSTFTAALKDALKQTNGDALVNVTTSTSLKGYIPIYNIFANTCTTVQGTAVKFVKQSAKGGR